MKKILLALSLFALPVLATTDAFAWGGGSWNRSASYTGRYGNTYNANVSGSYGGGSWNRSASVSGPYGSASRNTSGHYGGFGCYGAYGGFHAGYVSGPNGTVGVYRRAVW